MIEKRQSVSSNILCINLILGRRDQTDKDFLKSLSVPKGEHRERLHHSVSNYLSVIEQESRNEAMTAQNF